MNKLTCLSLDNWRLTNSVHDPPRSMSASRIQLMQTVLAIPTLRQLSAENCQLTGAEVMTILSSNNNNAIEKLSLSSNALGPSFKMSSLCQYANLTELYLSRASLEKIVSLKCPLARLTKLDLSANKISAIDLTCGGAQTALPALQWLNMSGNGMVLERHFPDCFPQLSVLDISGNTLIYTFQDITPLVRSLLRSK